MIVGFLDGNIVMIVAWNYIFVSLRSWQFCLSSAQMSGEGRFAIPFERLPREVSELNS